MRRVFRRRFRAERARTLQRSREQGCPGAIVKGGQREDAVVHAVSESRPHGTVPLGDAACTDDPRRIEVAVVAPYMIQGQPSVTP